MILSYILTLTHNKHKVAEYYKTLDVKCPKDHFAEAIYHDFWICANDQPQPYSILARTLDQKMIPELRDKVFTVE